ncbi:HPP family protein [Haloprofundus sp. MHR1]|uniref:HPP family protein n=1 Tax=Haloprofundus sp. MHR1 TaxID=2572921 RepID=UPI0010BF47D7|nr:HPP family protein [Haloprofundus sp. MHR1]QCJ46931.1 HPP family protein [Haloprofundus sp. MHR1]
MAWRRDKPGPASVHAAALMTVLGLTALVTGRAFLFPSLGPSAYVLATGIGDEDSAPTRVVGGHFIGVVAGMLTYHLLADGLVATQPLDPFSMAGVRLMASATVAVGLTTAAMLATDLRHPPACATTLIVGLGLLTSVEEAVIIMVAIVLLMVVQRGLLAIRRATGPLTVPSDEHTPEASKSKGDRNVADESRAGGEND